MKNALVTCKKTLCSILLHLLKNKNEKTNTFSFKKYPIFKKVYYKMWKEIKNKMNMNYKFKLIQFSEDIELNWKTR